MPENWIPLLKKKKKENILGNSRALKKKIVLSTWIFIYLVSLPIEKHWCFLHGLQGQG